jgi:single-strand DNA-binding protein
MSQITINRVVLVGRLTRDPELRSLPSGRAVTGLRIACNSSRRDAEGNTSERPHYFDVSAFGATAESVCRFTRKGSRVGIDGRLEWREWETDEHERRQAVNVVADVVQFLDTPGGGAGDRDGGDVSGEDQSRELVGVGADELDVAF